MTKRKSTKRALLLSALSLLMCVSMLIGSTFAWFTDSVTSGKNQIVAGNLDVELDYKKVVGGVATEWDTVKDQTEIFDPNALWEPGHVEVVYLRVSNKGSLELKYQLGVNFKDITIGKTEDGKDIKLSDHLVFATVKSNTETIYANRDEVVKAAAGTEKGLTDYNGETTPLEVNGVDYLTLIIYMPETVGNEANYRGDAIPTIELGINLYATQYTAEDDSFGIDYDKDAWADGMKVSTAEELEAALTTGGKVSLYADVALDESVEISKDTAINLRGYTMSSKTGEVLEVTDGAKVELGNGTIKANSEDANAITVSNTKAGTTSTLDLADVKIDFADVADPDYNAIVVEAEEGNAVLNVNDGTELNVIADWQAAIFAGKNAEVNVNGGEINVGNTLSNAYCVWGIYSTDNSAVINIDGGVFNVTGVHSASAIYAYENSATVNITGGIFNVKTTGGYGIAVEVYRGQVNATGGTFNIMATGGYAYAFEENSDPTKLDLNVGSNVTINVLERNGNTAYESGNVNPNADCTAKILTATLASTTDELINEIKNAPVGEETVILMADGTYADDINITVAALGAAGGDIIIRAADGAKPVIAGTVTIGYRQQNVGAASYNAKIIFDGVTFDHAEAGKHCLNVQDVESFYMVNCTVIGDGEFGLSTPGSNGTGAAKIEKCKFVNAGLQLAGKFSQTLTIDDCEFEESVINVQGGGPLGPTIQNSKFDITLKAAHSGQSFYVIRNSNAGANIKVENCEISVDAEQGFTGVAGSKGWGVFVNRIASYDMDVEDVKITMTDAALAQPALKVATCLSTGKINMTNVTLNGAVQ